MQKKKFLTGFWICLVMLVFSLFMVVHHYVAEEQAEEEFDALVEMIEEVETTDEGEVNVDESVQSPMEKYQELFRMNNDMYGWISIEGTNIHLKIFEQKESIWLVCKHEVLHFRNMQKHRQFLATADLRIFVCMFQKLL